MSLMFEEGPGAQIGKLIIIPVLLIHDDQVQKIAGYTILYSNFIRVLVCMVCRGVEEAFECSPLRQNFLGPRKSGLVGLLEALIY
jgi:hypothetical protein